MTTETIPARPGRPPLPIFHGEIERLAGLGLTAAQIADRVGVSRRTLFARMESDPALREAMDRGISAAVEMYATILQDEALRGNLTAIIYFLKTKGGFHVPKEAPAEAPAAPSGTRLAPITLDHCNDLVARQTALMARRKAEQA